MAVTRLKSARRNRQRRSGSRVERSPARNLGCGSPHTNTPGKYDHYYCSDRRTQSQRRKLIVGGRTTNLSLMARDVRGSDTAVSNLLQSFCPIDTRLMVWCTNNTISTSNMTTLKLSSFSHLIKSHKHHPTDI